MKLNQLRYLVSVIQNDLNITSAANKLHTSQPGVSKQIRLLEDELGFPLFERDGRHLTSVTDAGREVVERAHRILEEAQNIRRLSSEANKAESGSLSVGTTHTQARFVLPPIIQKFVRQFTNVDLHLHQGAIDSLANMASRDQVDLVIATGNHQLFPGYVHLPCFDWARCVVVPKDHPLAREMKLSLKALARFPIVTYNFSLSGQSSLPALFESANLKLKTSLTATDADVIKTYVRLGLGVGVMASLAYDKKQDHDLVQLNADHLFSAHRTWVGFRKGRLLRGYTFEFMKLLAPHLTRRRVELAVRAISPESFTEIFSDVQIPFFT